MAAWDRIAWAEYAQPWGKPPDTVPRLLSRLAAVGCDGIEDDPRSPLLFALGNDHAGTYYPLAVPAAKCVGEILRAGSAEARWQALDLLTDLVGSFEPDPAVVPTVEARRRLESELQEVGESLRPLATAMLHEGEGEERVPRAAREFLEALQRLGSRLTNR
jgi:hypothetical protein